MDRPHMGSDIVCLLCSHVFFSTPVGIGVPKSPNVHSVCSVAADAARIVTKGISVTVTVVFNMWAMVVCSSCEEIDKEDTRYCKINRAQ